MSLNITTQRKPGGAQTALVGTGDWPFFGLRREMERLFDSFFQGYDNPLASMEGARFMPATDVRENGKEICVTAELPGIAEKDVELYVSDDGLTIKGEKRAEREEKGEGRYQMERSYGSFYRHIYLPTAVNPDRAEAKFKNGVLEVHLPKQEEARKKEKRVEVKSAA